MKKIFTLFAAAMIAAGAFAQTEIAKYVGGTISAGTFTVGATDATKVLLDYSSSKYNKNTTACTVMTFATSITTKDNVPDYYVKIAVDGGFKSGDVVTFQPFTVMSTKDFSEGTKYGNIRIYGGNDTKVSKIYETNSTGAAKTVTDGHEEEGDVKSFSYTLGADCEALYIGRTGGTRVNVLSFVVTRGGETSIEYVCASSSKTIVKTATKNGIRIVKAGRVYNAAGQLVK